MHEGNQPVTTYGRELFIEKHMEMEVRSQAAPSPGSYVAWVPHWTGSRERFHHGRRPVSDAVKETFVRLHEEGLIYRGKRLVNWDPVSTHRGIRPGSGTL